MATVTSASAASFGSMNDLVDGDTNTRAYWPASTANDPGFYLQWDFGQDPQAVTQVRQAGFDTSGRHITGFTIKYSDDGLTWTEQAVLSNLAYPGNNTLPWASRHKAILGSIQLLTELQGVTWKKHGYEYSHIYKKSF